MKILKISRNPEKNCELFKPVKIVTSVIRNKSFLYFNTQFSLLVAITPADRNDMFYSFFVNSVVAVEIWGGR